MEGLQFPEMSKNSTCHREGSPKPQGLIPIMAYTVRLYPKQVTFSGFKYICKRELREEKSII